MKSHAGDISAICACHYRLWNNSISFPTNTNKTKCESSKAAIAKSTSPQCICYRRNLLRWMFLILCDNLKTLFYCKVYCYSEVFCTAMFFLLSYGQEVCILRCLHNAFSSYTKTANWSCRMSYLIKISNFIFWCFIRFYFGTISHFSFLFPQFIKRLKTSLGVCFLTTCH